MDANRSEADAGNVAPEMTYRPTRVERAFALAASGKIENLGGLRAALRAEGYIEDGRLYGRTITSQLSKLIAAAKAKAKTSD